MEIDQHAFMFIVIAELFTIALLLGVMILFNPAAGAARQIDVWGETFRDEIKEIHDLLRIIVRRLPLP